MYTVSETEVTNQSINQSKHICIAPYVANKFKYIFIILAQIIVMLHTLRKATPI